MAMSNLHSYPSVFRPTHDPDPKDGPTPIEKGQDNVDPLPLIDMECLDESKLDRACREWGIFRVVNHGVPTELLRKIQDHAKTIFDLPFESKQALANNTNIWPPIKYFWGSPALTPRANAAQNMDWVEGLNIPLGQLSSSLDHHHDHHHDNHVVDDDHLINDFRNLLEEYKGHLIRLASTMFEAMVRSLKLELAEPGMFIDKSADLLRVYRYPRVSVDHEHVAGMHVHTDSTVIAILNENEVGGLQFLKDDQCFDVKPIPTSLIVQLGDMIQALSDDEYKSVKHKVKANKQKEERVSICYFAHPHGNTIIQSSKYKPFTYNDFRAQVHHDLKTLGRKIGLQNFKLP